jgi:hypothetical protein
MDAFVSAVSCRVTHETSTGEQETEEWSRATRESVQDAQALGVPGQRVAFGAADHRAQRKRDDEAARCKGLRSHHQPQHWLGSFTHQWCRTEVSG